MEHSFNVQFAQKYGIEEAIIVHNLYFWLRKNIANGKHIYNGNVWTYNSNSAFVELFPYINKTKIFRVLKHLEDEGIILKDNFNKNLFDKTLWYAFSEHGFSELSLCQYDVFDFVKMNHPDNQSEPTIPYNKQSYNKTEEENTKRKKEIDIPTQEDHDVFEIFRKKYQGKKRGHDTEFNFFITQNKDWKEVLKVLDLAVTKENILREQAKRMKKFFPEPKNLQTYLGRKNRGWEQYVEDISTTKKDEYTPTLDGFNLRWLEHEQCYMTTFDFSMLVDGYTNENRPSCAIVMRNGIKYRWDVERKDWIKK